MEVDAAPRKQVRRFGVRRGAARLRPDVRLRRRNAHCGGRRDARAAGEGAVGERLHGTAGRAQGEELQVHGKGVLDGERQGAALAGKAAYLYRTPCEMFSDVDEMAGAKRRLARETGSKAYDDWAGDIASFTDRLAKAKVYVIVVALPRPDHFWAQGFADIRQRS